MRGRVDCGVMACLGWEGMGMESDGSVRLIFIRHSTIWNQACPELCQWLRVGRSYRVRAESGRRSRAINYHTQMPVTNMNSALTANGKAWRSCGWIRLVGIAAGWGGMLAGGLRSEGALVGVVGGRGETSAFQEVGEKSFAEEWESGRARLSEVRKFSGEGDEAFIGAKRYGMERVRRRPDGAFGERAISCVREPGRVTWPVAAFGVIVVLHRRRTPGVVRESSGWSGD